MRRKQIKTQLYSLKLNVVSRWNAEFYPWGHNYSIHLPAAEDTIAVHPIAKARGVLIFVNGLEVKSGSQSPDIALKYGTNLVEVTVKGGWLHSYWWCWNPHEALLVRKQLGSKFGCHSMIVQHTYATQILHS